MTQTTRLCAKCQKPFAFELRGAPRRYCDACKPTNAEACRTNYQKNRDSRIAKMREYHARTRETRIVQLREKWRQARLTTPWKHIMEGAKHRAKVGNFAFDLTEEWARSRWTGKCELTGLPFQLGLRNEDKRMFAASIDRIDAKIGYVQWNCRFILFAVNCMKQDGTEDEMFGIARALIKYSLRKRPP